MLKWKKELCNDEVKFFYYNCVGTLDGIANYRTMQNRINRIKANGTNAEIEIFNGLSHGFGLGEGTVANGWIDRAVNFWERQN